MVLPHTTSVIFRERVYRVSLSLYLPKTNSRCTEPFPAICISRSILPTTISAGPFKPGQDWVALDSCPSYLPTIQTTYLLHCPCNWNATMKGLLPAFHGVFPNGRRLLVNVAKGTGSNAMGGLRDAGVVNDLGSVACILTPYYEDTFELSDGNALNSIPGWAQCSFPLFLNLSTDIAEMNTDAPVLQLEDSMRCFNNYLIDPLRSMPFSHHFEPQAFIPESAFGVYVPFEYSPVACVTSTQEGTTAHHDALESPPHQNLSARAPNASHIFLPDDLPSPYRIQTPSESMTPPLRLHVGSPALASAKRKIRTHEAKYFCNIVGCGHDFTTKQNLKSMVFSLLV
ncbi:hypothetical protein K443DRAFT_114780 [Laccaria amethystina LaAM-08-1]|uniref:Uncharacterized protein n=1 Tax=Laccaria amethystina LaAM-08-1 TaxID=1095629 RepID=A0A0C9WN44_9AGAR|nr:hypothetical protein K443DRAFT_114780 [Laccaria amethystina LaAM-08-1]